jgi:hypothetical protein
MQLVKSSVYILRRRSLCSGKAASDKPQLVDPGIQSSHIPRRRSLCGDKTVSDKLLQLVEPGIHSFWRYSLQ